MDKLDYAIKHGGSPPKRLLQQITRRRFGAAVLGGLAGATALDICGARGPVENTSGNSRPPFTIAIIPDPQYLAESCGSGSYYMAMASWIVTNRNRLLNTSGPCPPFAANIKAVVGVGDCVNQVTPNECNIVQSFSSILYDNGLPFFTPPGNHDYFGNSPSSRNNLSGLFATDGYFSAAQQYARLGCGGMALGGGDMAYWAGSYDRTGANTAVRLEISGSKMLILSMDFFAGNAAWKWAHDVMRDHSDAGCYITTHAWLNSIGTPFKRNDTYGPDAYSMAVAPYSNSAAEAWSTVGVSTWDNLYGIFSGHDLVVSGNPNSWYWKLTPVQSSSERHQTVHQVFANTQQIDADCIASSNITTGAGQMASVCLASFLPELGVVEYRMISAETGNWITKTGWSASETLLCSVPLEPMPAVRRESVGQRGDNCRSGFALQ